MLWYYVMKLFLNRKIILLLDWSNNFTQNEIVGRINLRGHLQL